MNDSKLTALRAKTDRQLLAVIARKLDAGLEAARRGLLMQARTAHREVRSLLPLVHDVPAADRRRLESKFARLQNAVESGAAGLRIQTACF